MKPKDLLAPLFLNPDSGCYVYAKEGSRMPRIVPSQLVSAIDNLFGPSRNELSFNVILFRDRNSVRTLLSLLDQLPDELITVSFHEYTEFLQCQSALVSALSIWDAQGQGPAALNVGAKDPVERIRRILAVCPDENPPPYPDLAFIRDQNARANVQQDIRAAWIDFRSDEWKGATVFATNCRGSVAVLEAKVPNRR
jgi:hypothetical protein